jgi:hypothetical protein
MASNRLVRRNAASPAVPGVDLPTLDLAEVEHDTTEALVARGAAYVREYAAVEHKPTILLYNIATVLVALRGQHTTEDGSPDWRGRSGPYRVDAAEIYRPGRICCSLARRKHLAPAPDRRRTTGVRPTAGLSVGPSPGPASAHDGYRRCGSRGGRGGGGVAVDGHCCRQGHGRSRPAGQGRNQHPRSAQRRRDHGRYD